MMQRSLFDQSNLLKIEFQKKLCEFCFAEAFELLNKFAEYMDVISQLEKKKDNR